LTGAPHPPTAVAAKHPWPANRTDTNTSQKIPMSQGFPARPLRILPMYDTLAIKSSKNSKQPHFVEIFYKESMSGVLAGGVDQQGPQSEPRKTAGVRDGMKDCDRHSGGHPRFTATQRTDQVRGAGDQSPFSHYRGNPCKSCETALAES